MTVSAAASSAASTSTSTTSVGSGTNLLSVLASAAKSAAQLQNTKEISLIDGQIQTQLNAKIAALQTNADPSILNMLQSQITSLTSQRTTINTATTGFGSNTYTLSDLQNQLANLQTAAANGDSATFDATLSAANTDVSNLGVVQAPAPFQPDGVAGLQGHGLGISSSATYDLSTPSGQAAAEAAITAAQNMVNQVFQVTSTNQLIGNSIVTTLNSQINSLTTEQQNEQNSTSAAAETQIAQLTQNAQNEEHLIELSLGSTTTLASALAAAETTTQPPSSPLEVLSNAVGATAQSVEANQSTPAILSLLV